MENVFKNKTSHARLRTISHALREATRYVYNHTLNNYTGRFESVRDVKTTRADLLWVCVCARLLGWVREGVICMCVFCSWCAPFDAARARMDDCDERRATTTAKTQRRAGKNQNNAHRPRFCRWVFDVSVAVEFERCASSITVEGRAGPGSPVYGFQKSWIK